MRNVYHKTTSESGLSVGIDKFGICISELTYVRGLIEDLPDGDWLVTTAHFSWNLWKNRFKKNLSCYSGDDGSGKMVDRIVSGAISLLAYYGGREEFITNKKNFEKIE